MLVQSDGNGGDFVGFNITNIAGSNAETTDYSLSQINLGTLAAGVHSIDLSDPTATIGGNVPFTGDLVINEDNLVEGNEAIGISIIGAIGGALGATTPTSQHTIDDDEGATLTVGNVTIGEDGGAQSVPVTLTPVSYTHL